jgi:AAA domain, putative AbiEii toxin, Type IV TA system
LARVLPERVSSLGPTFVELLVAFEPEEVSLTSELFLAWQNSLPPERRETLKIVPPSQHNEVTLRFEDGRVSSPQGFEAVNQFRGRSYVKALSKAQPKLKDSFAKLGDVFWFDQHRNLGSLLFDERDAENNGFMREGWNSGVEQLRRFLITWWAHHTTPNKRGRDNIIPLQELVNRVFPGTQFIGVMPRDYTGSELGEDSYFLLDRNGRVYDLAEMSSGEQAVFPLAYEFVRLDIKRSIVLIDELELHLHPPEQQRLLAALPKIGPDCQFLITTHSEFLTSAIPNEQEVRLERGTRCL